MQGLQWFVVALVLGAYYRCYTLEKEISALNDKIERIYDEIRQSKY